MTRELSHHCLDLPEIKDLFGRVTDVEVWDDVPDRGSPPNVMLCLGMDASTRLTPNEARALAALLINAADHQDRRAREAA